MKQEEEEEGEGEVEEEKRKGKKETRGGRANVQQILSPLPPHRAGRERKMRLSSLSSSSIELPAAASAFGVCARPPPI